MACFRSWEGDKVKSAREDCAPLSLTPLPLVYLVLFQETSIGIGCSLGTRLCKIQHRDGAGAGGGRRDLVIQPLFPDVSAGSVHQSPDPSGNAQDTSAHLPGPEGS